MAGTTAIRPILKKEIRIPLVGLAVWIASFCANAEPKEFEGLSLELVAEQTAIRPSEPFTVGLRIRHATGYHTYWKNPGIVGIPTKIQWQLPEGFVAGHIEWPQPQLTKMAIYPVYGYEGEILLPVTISPPPKRLEAATLSNVQLQANVSWMCCSKTCHPGFGELTLSLPVETKASPLKDSTQAHLFKNARDALPVQSNAWNITASLESGSIDTVITPVTQDGAPPSLPDPESVYFFSSDGLVDSRALQQPELLGGNAPGIKLVLTVSEHAPKPDPSGRRLRGVLVSNQPWTSDSQANALSIDVPVIAKTTK